MDVDITDYRDLQERNREEETLRSLVFSSVTDVIFYLSVEPGGRFRYVSVNPAFHTATGLSDEQVIGKLVEEVVPSPPAVDGALEVRRSHSKRPARSVGRSVSVPVW